MLPGGSLHKSLFVLNYKISFVPLINMIVEMTNRRGLVGTLADRVLPTRTPGMEPTKRFPTSK